MEERCARRKPLMNINCGQRGRDKHRVRHVEAPQWAGPLNEYLRGGNYSWRMATIRKICAIESFSENDCPRRAGVSNVAFIVGNYFEQLLCL